MRCSHTVATTLVLVSDNFLDGDNSRYKIYFNLSFHNFLPCDHPLLASYFASTLNKKE